MEIRDKEILSFMERARSYYNLHKEDIANKQNAYRTEYLKNKGKETYSTASFSSRTYNNQR